MYSTPYWKTGLDAWEAITLKANRACDISSQFCSFLTLAFHSKCHHVHEALRQLQPFSGSTSCQSYPPPLSLGICSFLRLEFSSDIFKTIFITFRSNATHSLTPPMTPFLQVTLSYQCVLFFYSISHYLKSLCHYMLIIFLTVSFRWSVLPQVVTFSLLGKRTDPLSTQ